MSAAIAAEDAFYQLKAVVAVQKHALNELRDSQLNEDEFTALLEISP